MAIPILSDIFGTKPQIAQYKGPSKLSDEQLKSLEADLAAFPDIQELGSLFQSMYLQDLNKAIPGFSDILAMGGQTTRDMQKQADLELKGYLPPDVVDEIQRSSAFTSLGSGIAGSPMARSLTARDLGLTSLNLITQGAQLAGQAGSAAQQWANLSGAQAAGNIASGMLITPQQQQQFDVQRALIEQATKQAQYNVNAAPNPIAKGLSDIVENLTAAYLGGKVGAIGAGNAAATSAAGGGLSGSAANVVYGGNTGSGYLGSGPGGPGPGDVTTPGYYIQPDTTTNLNPNLAFGGMPSSTSFGYAGAENLFAPNMYGVTDFNV